MATDMPWRQTSHPKGWLVRPCCGAAAPFDELAWRGFVILPHAENCITKRLYMPPEVW